MPYYFAYGSNMSPRQMQRRCPGSRPVGAARLPGWRFIITTRGGANIVTAPGEDVHGSVWHVTQHHLAQLDRWEGVSAGVYRRKHIPVERRDGTVLTAVVYVADRTWPGIARPDYMLTAILPGAVAFNLPQNYQQQLRSWLAPRPIGPVTAVYRGRRSKPRHPKGRADPHSRTFKRLLKPTR